MPLSPVAGWKAHGMWHHIFSLPLTVPEKVARAALIYFFLLVALRVAGKRELAQLSTADFVVLMAVANAVQNGIIGDDSSVTGGWIGATTLFVLNGLIGILLFRSVKARKLIEGEPTVLIEHGQVLHENLRKEHLTMEDLLVAIQRQGLDDLSEVDQCTLEPNGTIVVKKRRDSAEMKAISELTAKVDALAARMAG
jgi:uncharacterized membrane protein YcaP (DUF421 family)